MRRARCLHLALCLGAFISPVSAHAEPFAAPPDEPAVARPTTDEYDDSPRLADAGDAAPESVVRLHVGPALAFSEHTPQTGLFAALDVGERAAGARFSAAWLQVGTGDGRSQYGAELWLDFGAERRLHPILGAGAGVARSSRSDAATSQTHTDTIGVGLLRAGLEYGLGIRGTDARAGLDVIGSVPAIQARNTPNVEPWLLVVGSVAVGF